MVKLVHDHDIEVRRGDFPNVRAVKALDRCEHVLEPRRPLPANPLLAESGVAQRIPERRAALIEDLFAVSDEQEATAAELRSKTRVVDGSDHGLPGARGRDDQVAMVALVTSEDDLLEQRLLERPQRELDRAEQC